MNSIQLMALAEKLSDQQLQQSARAGSMPEIIAMSEMMRRKNMRDTPQTKPPLDQELIGNSGYAEGGEIYAGNERLYDERRNRRPLGGELDYFRDLFGLRAPTTTSGADTLPSGNDGGDGAGDGTREITETAPPGAPGTGNPLSDIPNALGAFANVTGLDTPSGIAGAAMGALTMGPVGALVTGIVDRAGGTIIDQARNAAGYGPVTKDVPGIATAIGRAAQQAAADIAEESGLSPGIAGRGIPEPNKPAGQSPAKGFQNTSSEEEGRGFIDAMNQDAKNASYAAMGISFVEQVAQERQAEAARQEAARQAAEEAARKAAEEAAARQAAEEAAARQAAEEAARRAAEEEAARKAAEEAAQHPTPTPTPTPGQPQQTPAQQREAERQARQAAWAEKVNAHQSQIAQRQAEVAARKQAYAQKQADYRAMAQAQAEARQQAAQQAAQAQQQAQQQGPSDPGFDQGSAPQQVPAGYPDMATFQADYQQAMNNIGAGLGSLHDYQLVQQAQQSGGYSDQGGAGQGDYGGKDTTGTGYGGDKPGDMGQEGPGQNGGDKGDSGFGGDNGESSAGSSDGGGKGDSGDAGNGGDKAYGGGPVSRYGYAEGGEVQDAYPADDINASQDASPLTDEELDWLEQLRQQDELGRTDGMLTQTSAIDLARRGAGAVARAPGAVWDYVRNRPIRSGIAGYAGYRAFRPADQQAMVPPPANPSATTEGGSRPSVSPSAGGGGGGSASLPTPPDQAAPPADPDARRRMRIQEERDRMMAEDGRRRGGLSATDLAMIQLGLGMMGSSRKQPLAALSDAATPAIRTYTEMARNERQDRDSRDRRMSELAYREDMLDRYAEDRRSREQIAGQSSEDRRAALLARAAGRGRGASTGGRTEAELRRGLARIAMDRNMSEDQRAAASARLREVYQGGGSSQAPADPLGIR